MNRESFLGRVRQAAESGRAWRITHQELPAEVGYVGARGDLCNQLAAEIQEVGGLAQVVETHEAARTCLSELLEHYQTRLAICWRHPLLERLGLRELLAARGVQHEDYESLRGRPESELRATLLAADVGITSVDFAIAESGTLVVRARPGQERCASLVAPVHVAIVQSAQIVPDLIDAVTRFPAADGSLGSNIALITGPSKTGDIELQLTTGVHGPGKWHVIVAR